MLDDRDWDSELDDIFVPSGDSVRLTYGELCLIDWALCTGSGLAPFDFEELIDNWHELRLEVWDKIDLIAKDKSEKHGVLCTFGEATIRILLTILPTVHMWGDEDAGFSLKMKLAQRMNNTYVDPQIQQDQDDIEAEKIRIQKEVEAEAKKLEEEENARQAENQAPPED